MRDFLQDKNVKSFLENENFFDKKDPPKLKIINWMNRTDYESQSNQSINQPLGGSILTLCIVLLYRLRQISSRTSLHDFHRGSHFDFVRRIVLYRNEEFHEERFFCPRRKKSPRKRSTNRSWPYCRAMENESGSRRRDRPPMPRAANLKKKRTEKKVPVDIHFQKALESAWRITFRFFIGVHLLDRGGSHPGGKTLLRHNSTLFGLWRKTDPNLKSNSNGLFQRKSSGCRA